MKRHSFIRRAAVPAAASLLIGCGSSAQTPKPAVTTVPASLRWQPSWPGTEEAFTKGDQTTPGTPFEFYFRMPPGYTIAPHTHPGDAHIEVITGELRLGHGTTMDTSAARRFGPGATTSVAAGMVHFEAAGPVQTTIRVWGTAPWGIRFVDPTKDPMRQ